MRDHAKNNVKNLEESKICHTFAPGKVAEWSNAPVLKTDELRGSGGSNPSLSAQRRKERHPDRDNLLSGFFYPYDPGKGLGRTPVPPPPPNITARNGEKCGRKMFFCV